MKLRIFLAALTLMVAGGDIARADNIETLDDVVDVSDAWYLNPHQYPVLDRAINVYSAEALRPGTLQLVFDHRVRQSLSDEPFHEFLGFDAGGLKVGLGLRYGFFANLDAGVYRLNGTVETFDTYEFDARYQFLRQLSHRLDLAVRAGLSWFTEKDTADASGGFVQLLANTTFAHRIKLGTGLLYHSESSNADKADSDDAHSLAIPGALEYRLTPSLSVTFEIVSAIDGYRSAHPAISSGLKIITRRHIFTVLVSNSQYVTADGIVSNSATDFGDAAIGFTITKELGI